MIQNLPEKSVITLCLLYSNILLWMCCNQRDYNLTRYNGERLINLTIDFMLNLNFQEIEEQHNCLEIFHIIWGKAVDKAIPLSENYW
jgi:hypothetical protein